MTETLDAKTYYEREAVEKIRGEPDDPWRFRYTAKALPPAFDSLLDVGCGEGRWLSYLQRRRPGPRLTGIELSATRVEEIQRSAPGFRVEVGGLPDLPYDDDAFDVVTCLEVVEHIPDWKTAVTELLRVARRRVIITVPYRERIRQHSSWMGCPRIDRAKSSHTLQKPALLSGCWTIPELLPPRR